MTTAAFGQAPPPLPARPPQIRRLPQPWWRTVIGQLRYDLLGQVRNRAAVFFSLALPVLFLLSFTMLSGGGAESARYYTPATMVIAAVSGTLTNLSITLVYLREYGMLKRLWMLPVSRGALMTARLTAAGIFAGAAAAVLAVVGGLLYGVWPSLPAHLLLAVVLTVTTGCVLGAALAALVRSESTIGPVGNAVALPLLLASGAFFPLDEAPRWLCESASYLPVEPVLALAVRAYDETAGGGSVLRAVLVSAVWTALAAVVYTTRFSWAPLRKR